MVYNFDKIIDRKGTGAVKFDAIEKVFGKDDLLPLWVADMDFETPDFIVEAMRERLEHPIFGYPTELPDYRPSICDWIESHHQWEIQKEWLCFIPGIVKGIGIAINALLEKGDKVIIQPPVYHPFRLVPQKNHHEVVFNPLRELPEGGYEMDFENLEEIRKTSMALADPRGLSQEDIDALVQKGKAVCVQSMSLHATGIGGTQMAPILAYDMAT